MQEDEAEGLRGEIVALDTALAAAFGEIAVLRAAAEGSGSEGALRAMEAMAAQLEGTMLRGVVGAADGQGGWERGQSGHGRLGGRDGGCHAQQGHGGEESHVNGPQEERGDGGRDVRQVRRV